MTLSLSQLQALNHLLAQGGRVDRNALHGLGIRLSTLAVLAREGYVARQGERVLSMSGRGGFPSIEVGFATVKITRAGIVALAKSEAEALYDGRDAMKGG